MKPYRWRRRVRFFSFALISFLAGSLLLMLLWNALMPDLFGLPELDFLQAMGLLLLSRILFGGRPLVPRGRWRRRFRKTGDHRPCGQAKRAGNVSPGEGKDEWV